MEDYDRLKTIGIVAHSAEGAGLSFVTACHEGEERLGPHLHPPLIMSAIPMGLSIEAWHRGDYETIVKHLSSGVKQLADAGADFFICPDNTAHLVLEEIVQSLPIPGLHIAESVCREILDHRWECIGLLGTRWTMSGSVYATALEDRGLERIVPEARIQEQLNTVIVDELCRGVFRDETRDYFSRVIEELASRGAECVILGCTEIPLIVTAERSPLPLLDSARLQARDAVRIALDEGRLECDRGWLPIPPQSGDRTFEQFYPKQGFPE